MANNPMSARRLPIDDPFFDSKPSDLSAKFKASQPLSPRIADRPGQVIGHPPNTPAGGYRHEVREVSYAGHLPQTSGDQPGLRVVSPPNVRGYLPQTYDNQPGWGLVSPLATGYFPETYGNQSGWGPLSPPVATGYFPQMYGNQQDWGHLASPNIGGNLPQTPTNQQRPNPLNSPDPRVQASAPQPHSVKHLTCWYWANKGCKLADDVCLYAHFDTGRLADPPVQVQRGRPAVAGKNATNPQPVYKDWKGHRRVHSTVGDPQIQKQIEHIYAKAAQHSTPTLVKAEQSEAANMVKVEGFGSTQPAVNFNRPHPNDHPSPPTADSYRNISIGFGAPSEPFHQQFSHYPHQAGGNFTAPSPATEYTGGSTHYGLGGHYIMGGNHGGMGGIGGKHGGMSGHHGPGGNLTNYGPGSHQFGGNSPNNPNTFVSPGQFGGQLDGPTQEMQKQMRVKDKVITELADIVEMLEINYGISIDDQTNTLQKLLNIARAMEADAKKARQGENAASSGKSMDNYIHQSAGASASSSGRPAVNHEHILTAIEGSLNLVTMEKMVLARSKARKHAIGEDLETINAAKLLPRGWTER